MFFFCLFFIEEEIQDQCKVVPLLDPSVLSEKKSIESQSKYL